MPGIEEPFGVAYVEAMAAGLPAIGSRGEGGPEDIAAAGEGMVLVEPDDVSGLAATIERLIGDRGRTPAARSGCAPDRDGELQLGGVRGADARGLRGRDRGQEGLNVPALELRVDRPALLAHLDGGARRRR